MRKKNESEVNLLTSTIDKPFFSIVIPAYNCEDTVGNTISSILNQSFKSFELIIVNDGSNDNTKNVLETFKDPRISILTIINSGPGNARNIGIRKTIGKYLILVDSDDLLDIDSLQKRYLILAKNEVDLIIGSYNSEILDGGVIVNTKDNIAPNMNIKTHKQFLKVVLPLMEKQLMYVIWNKVYKLELIKENNVEFPSYNSCEDRLFNIAYFHHVDTCVVTEEIFYNYSFDGKSSLTNKYSENKFKTFVEFYVRTSQLLPYDKSGVAALFLKGAMSSFVSLHTESCPLNRKEKFNYIKMGLNNKFLQEATDISESDSLIKCSFKFLFRLRSVLAHYFISWMINKLHNINPVIIEKLKRNY